MRRLKLLPIFRCLYCGLPHPARYCPEVKLRDLLGEEDFDLAVTGDAEEEAKRLTSED